MGVAERRQREREERRSQIIDAAERVFLDRGLAATTVEHVAREAEVSKGTVYLYFRSKDELYLASALRSLGQLAEALEQASLAQQTGFSHLESMVDIHLRFLQENTDRFRLGTAWLSGGYQVDSESPTYDEYKQAVARIFATAHGAIEAGKQDGSVRPDVDASLFTVQLWGGMHGVLMLWLNGAEVTRRMPAPVDLDLMVTDFMALILTGIRASGLHSSAASAAQAPGDTELE